MLDLYEVRLEKFISADKMDFTVRYEIDLDSTKIVHCIKKDDEMMDIKTLELYHLFKRCSDGYTIHPSEQIELNKYYAVEATPCDKSLYETLKCSLIEQKMKKDTKKQFKKVK